MEVGWTGEGIRLKEFNVAGANEVGKSGVGVGRRRGGGFQTKAMIIPTRKKKEMKSLQPRIFRLNSAGFVSLRSSRTNRPLSDPGKMTPSFSAFWIWVQK